MWKLEKLMRMTLPSRITAAIEITELLMCHGTNRGTKIVVQSGTSSPNSDTHLWKNYLLSKIFFYYYYKNFVMHVHYLTISQVNLLGIDVKQSVN